MNEKESESERGKKRIKELGKSEVLWVQMSLLQIEKVCDRENRIGKRTERE